MFEVLKRFTAIGLLALSLVSLRGTAWMDLDQDTDPVAPGDANLTRPTPFSRAGVSWE